MNPNEPLDYTDMTIAHLEEILDEKLKEISTLVDDVVKGNEIISRKNTKIDELKLENSQLIDVISDANEQLQDITQKLEIMKNTIIASTKNTLNLHDRIEFLQNELSDIEFNKEFPDGPECDERKRG